jgi:4-hydroxy-3-polyprenylbenzoate decarboxylase
VKRIIIAITGASGAIYGIRALELLNSEAPGVEVHAIITAAARVTIAQETNWDLRDVEALADVSHDPDNVGASIASGSFSTADMLVAPCSIKTLSSIANCFNINLVARAVDVQLKEGRPVVLLVRETPLHLGHIRLMALAAENGAVIMPPVPAFCNRPSTVDDIVDETVERALFRLGVMNEFRREWPGTGQGGMTLAG